MDVISRCSMKPALGCVVAPGTIGGWDCCRACTSAGACGTTMMARRVTSEDNVMRLFTSSSFLQNDQLDNRTPTKCGSVVHRESLLLAGRRRRPKTVATSPTFSIGARAYAPERTPQVPLG